MPINVRCPGCGSIWPATDTLAGKCVKCPACRESMSIPSVPTTAAAVAWVSDSPVPRRAGPFWVVSVLFAVILMANLVSYKTENASDSYGFPFFCVSKKGPFVYTVAFVQATPDGRAVTLEGEEYVDAYEKKFGYRPRPTWVVTYAGLVGNCLFAIATVGIALAFCQLIRRPTRTV